MADKITQVFSIDASQALAALGQLDKAFADVNAQLDRVAGAITSFNRRTNTTNQKLNNAAAAATNYNTALGQLANGGLNSVATAATSTNASLNTFGRGAQSSLGQATAAAQKFTITWETLSRVVFTQFIVRAMSQIRDAISEAVVQAIEFQRQIALIKTITPDASINTIAKSVRDLSDAFNLPLIDTAAGVYQALSNQVGNFGESLRFTEEAAKFAKSTNSSLADSVDLLSGALRAYGLTVEDTGRVAGIFFTAIDKGRITADQLANSLGRVLEPASQVGISLEELSAGIASISDKGLGTAESLTQFRGIITGLTKPTDAMKDKLRELGFSSTEAAVATRGLDGILEDLRQSTSGSSQELAKLFPNVRGLGGALGLTGENLKTFSDNIKAARENGEEFANKKFLEATGTQAEQLTKELNKLKNAFVEDLGQAIVRTGADLLTFAGGAESLTTGIKVLVPTLIIAAEGAVALGVGIGSVKLAALATATPVTTLATALGALTLAIPAALGAIKNARTRNALSSIETQLAAAEQVLENFRDNAAEELRIEENKNKEILKAVGVNIQDINKEYLRDVENAKSANTAVVDNTKRSLDQISGARERFLKRISTAIADSQQSIRDSLLRIQEIEDRQGQRKFEFQTQGFSDAQKAFALLNRSSNIAKEAENTLRRAFQTGDEDLRKRAISLFQRADATALEAQNIGKSANNRSLELRAFKQLETLSKNQISAEKEINRLQQDRQKRLEIERSRQEKILAQIKEQAKVVLDNTGAFDKQGQQFDPDKQAERAAKRGEALKKIAELSFSSKDFKAADALGLANFVQTIEVDLSRRPIKLAFDVESNIKGVEAQINRQLAQFDLKFPFVGALEQALGRGVRTSPEALRQGLQQANDELAAGRKVRQEQQNINREIEKRRELVRQVVTQLEAQVSRDDTNLGADSLKPARDGIKEAILLFKQLSESEKVSQTELVNLANKLAGLDFGSESGQLLEQVKLAEQVFTQLNTLRVDLEQKAALPEVDTSRLILLQQIIDQAEASTFDQKLNSSAQSMANFVNDSLFISQNAEDTALAYERAAAALQRSLSGGTPKTRKFGGPMYFANGGFSRGTDVIPAALSPGEFVVNSQSSRKFFSQLQAINAGRQPVFRQDGGSTGIGDVTNNITINGSQTPQATAREVMKEIRREMRRNTGRL